MPQDIERHRLRSRLDAAVAARSSPLPTPAMVVDLDAFDANAADLVRRAGGKPLRVASKSLRVPDLLRRALAHDGFRGVLSYSLREALWLHDRGISDDIVLGYPTVDRACL
jgi:D-serine deaminase-like pyridoxal phosphate-dependent protein